MKYCQIVNIRHLRNHKGKANIVLRVNACLTGCISTYSCGANLKKNVPCPGSGGTGL